ncbi:MAG TPA: hypothetical protein VLB84_11690, partial [Bacteroidia bacterium]|nr:hypothetical protein [Bacteroidia bacterium]
MMSRKILITGCLNLLFTLYSFSQASVVWSELDTQDSRIPFARWMFLNEKYVYYFRHQSGSGDHLYLNLYNTATLKRVTQTELYPEFPKLKGRFGGMMPLKDKLLCFRYEYDNKSKGYVSYAKKITLDGELDQSETKVAVIQGKANATSFSYKTTRNEDKVLLLENTEVNDKNRTMVTLFDSNLKKNWNKTIPININKQRFKVKKYFIQKYIFTIDETVYLLVCFEKEDSSNQPRYFYNLYFFDPAKEELKEMPLEIDDKYISISFDLNMKNEAVVMGTYSNSPPQNEPFFNGNNMGLEKKKFSVAGIFYFNAKMNQINAKAILPFESSFLNTIDEDDLTKDKKEIYTLSFDGMYVDENMNGYLLGQQYYNVKPGLHSAEITHGYARDTYVVKVKNDGTLAWEKSIRKS